MSKRQRRDHNIAPMQDAPSIMPIRSKGIILFFTEAQMNKSNLDTERTSGSAKRRTTFHSRDTARIKS
jgi:hypothetical protein